MLKKYYPYEYVEDVFSIDYKKIFNKGYKGIIFDLDNTLVPHGNDSTEEINNLFKQIQDIGLKTFILSDNGKKRIDRFLENITNCSYIDNAGKPNPENYYKAIKEMNLKKNEVVYIGDQIFTDILGANNAGIANILVKFIGYKTEKKIGIKRHIEKIILKLYSYNKKYTNRLGDILIEDKKIKKDKKLLSQRNSLFLN